MKLIITFSETFIMNIDGKYTDDIRNETSSCIFTDYTLLKLVNFI